MNTTQLIQILPQTISLNQMISLVTEIEAEVYASPIYCHALAALTKKSKKEKSTAGILKKFTRSVIRVAFQRFMTRPQFPEQPFELSNHAVTNDFPNEPTENIPTSTIYPTVEAGGLTVHQAETNVSQPVTETSKASSSQNSDDFINKVKGFGAKVADSIESFNFSKTNSEKAEVRLKSPNNRKQEREERLKKVGGQLRDARLAKSMTIRQINLKTAIMFSHIEAIENGWFTKLPEDIYLQGYIRRIGDVLGLDGDALAKEFMTDRSSLLPETGILESDEDSETNNSQKFYLNSTHLFCGYLTLVAGVIGMLSSTINPADSHRYIPASESDRNEPPACKDINNSPPDRTPELNSLDNSVIVQLSISPPELL